MSVEILKQGAEGRIYLGTYKDQKCLIKERFIKNYRHEILDTQITKQRMKAETKAVGRCENVGIKVPQVLHMDLNERKIYMEYFCNAITVKDYIHNICSENANKPDEIKSKLVAICSSIGHIIGKMHANNIIHGDLTTSNILIDPVEEGNFDKYEIVFIDFGLSQYSQGVEDKGVDLYVLERALLSTHSEQPYLFESILETYRKECGSSEHAIVSKFEEVRARGRKRTMIG